VQDEAHTLAAMTVSVITYTGHYDRRTVVAAHGIERNQDWG
jgi:hypothetical protein